MTTAAATTTATTAAAAAASVTMVGQELVVQIAPRSRNATATLPRSGITRQRSNVSGKGNTASIPPLASGWVSILALKIEEYLVADSSSVTTTIIHAAAYATAAAAAGLPWSTCRRWRRDIGVVVVAVEQGCPLRQQIAFLRKEGCVCEPG